jgi:hypothetical protein
MGSRACYSLTLLLLLALALHASPVEAVNPETLLMPGKLTKSHQKFEEHCSLCHDVRDRSRQTSLCLDCHKEIAADIRNRRGLHGHTPAIATSKCSACHVDHLGRDADIAELDRARFDHDLTDFPLRGAHAGLACASCHAPRKHYRDAPHECAGCHARDDAHGGKLGRDCAACHGTDSWWHTHYDHDKSGFPLRGAHASLACAQCHIANRYKGTPKDCVSCHATDDVHHGSRGTNCGSCHTVSGWKTSKFDHLKSTGFALLGAHARLDCQDCHRSGNLKAKIPKTCIGCHRGQDPHAGRLGSDCGRCHGNTEWKPPKFDHARDGHWALTGAHAKLGCFDCHTAAVASQKLATKCVSCHRVDDVHRGKLGKDCAACHSASGWRTDLRFDHDRTGFPLAGLHVAVPCEQCHLTREFSDTPKRCGDCHASDDIHKGAFGHDCARCHSPVGWAIWQFDHAKATHFPLTGAHATIACAACHRRPPDQEKLRTDCVGCHAQDDVHAGQFGSNCGRCHTTRTFKGAEAR